jgi:TolB-like protein/Flp pilus assembly protein TadD
MSADVLKFSDFELDLSAYELRRDGCSLKLERIPMELLRLLVEQRGQLVTREAIIEKLWGHDVFLDTDNGINTAVRKIRQALEDDIAQPRFLHTVPGKGYRFSATVTEDGDGSRRPAAGKLGRRIMLAVLPFENLSKDAGQEYFSDGLTEETITHLGSLGPDDMGVIARTSSMAYKRTTKTIAQIGPELGVDYVLEGSVRREQNRVRITAQLIRTADQVHLWAQSYDRDLGSVLMVQRELAVAIAQQVQLRLRPQSRLQPLRSLEENPQAHDTYLRGRYHWAKRTYPEVTRARGYFQQAILENPNFARAYAGLADCYTVLPITSDAPARECFPQARIAATKALELDDTLAEAHTSLGIIHFWFDWDAVKAESQFQAALKLNPNHVLARLYRAHCLSNSGQHDEALEEIMRARKLDPLSPFIHTLQAEFLYHARRYPEAIAEFYDALELDPNFWVALVNLAKVHERTGDFSAAIAALEKAAVFSGGNTEVSSMLGYVMAVTGQAERARAIISELRDLARQRYVPPYNIALIYAGLEEEVTMHEYLERAYDERDVRMTFLLDPKWDAFRPSTRFQNLLSRVGLEQKAA